MLLSNVGVSVATDDGRGRNTKEVILVDARDRYIAAQNRLLDTHGVDAVSRFVSLPWREHRTHVLHVESGDEAPEPLVFVHGGGCFAAIWAPLLARLAHRPLFAVDRPGFGLTDPIDQRPGTLRRDAVAFLAGLLDALAIERGIFVANSMGSLWTVWLALDRPSRVERMVHIGCPAMLFETGAPLPLRLLATPMVGPLLMTLNPPSQASVRATLEAMGEAEAFQDDPALADAWLAAEQLPTFGEAWRSVLRSVLTLFGPREGVSLTCETLGRVSQLTRLIWGKDDHFGSMETAQRAVDCLPKANGSVVPGGHLPWLDAPNRVADLVREFVQGPQANRPSSAK